jgi:hypothetical protein
MTYAPLAIKRRHVLGDIYDRCDHVESVPVYMDDKSGEPLGYADESLGHFADAFLFHLPEMICKKLSTGHFDYVFDCEYIRSPSAAGRKRIKLNGILLVPKKNAKENASTGTIRS